MTTIDRSDTNLWLAHHVSGEEYVIKDASEWTDDAQHCLGARIIGVVGPLTHDDPRDCLRDNYDLNMTDDDAEWAEAELEAGRIPARTSKDWGPVTRQPLPNYPRPPLLGASAFL